MNELEIIRELSAKCPSHSSVLVGIGDDTAVLRSSRERQLVCKDMLLEGVHFELATSTPARIGHKALAVNLSDIAAMGGIAHSAYVGLALPRALCKGDFLDNFYAGMSALARQFDVGIAGGDTNIWDGPLVVSVTVVGQCHPRGAVLRSGAKVGDLICVTGPLGDSLATGHHLDFTPRLREAKAIMDLVPLHSMIDISDGLAKDLRMICQQSQTQAILRKTSLPLRPSLSTQKRDPYAAALDDGEDFELCFTLGADMFSKLQNELPQLPLFVIGFMKEGEGLFWEDEPGVFRPIKNQGFEHRS